MRVLVFLLVAVAITAAHGNRFMAHEEELTERERTLAMDEAVQEALVITEARRIAKKHRVTSNKELANTTFHLFHKLFKKPSEEAKKIGKADHLYRDIVDRAERKMLQVKRAKVSMSQGPKARTESLAETLYHRPGSVINSKELTRAWQLAQNLFGATKVTPICDYENHNIYRTIDGTCNNDKNPLWGSSGTAFSRVVGPSYKDDISSLRGTDDDDKKSFSKPSARLISSEIVKDGPTPPKDKDEEFTHLLMQFGQFLDHDMDLGPEIPEETEEDKCEECHFSEGDSDACHPIEVPDKDKSFKEGTCIPFRRSVSCSNDHPNALPPREQLNDVTSFIDGSMIYGSRLCLSVRLRQRKMGLLKEKMNSYGKPSLPFDEANDVLCRDKKECFLCGDVRCNEQISLTIMHTLWLREHNRCAREMTTVNSHWDDERLYQECRRIVGALIQKIVYEDYLPKILGSNFDTFIGKYNGYQKKVDPSIPNSFATAAYRYGHSLVRPEFARLSKDYEPMTSLSLLDAFFSPDQFKHDGTDPIIRGWVTDKSRRMDEFMNTILTTELFKTTDPPGLDLASLNIQRGRDHGLPVYSEFIKHCKKEFGVLDDDELFKPENSETATSFTKLYKSIDNADVWIAGVAEKRLKSALLGPTFACIFGITFRAVRDGDRYFWERKGLFTEAQQKSIGEHTFSRIICDNSDGIETIQEDAFLPVTERQSCSNVDAIKKGVDFQLFKENDCHIRVRLDELPKPDWWGNQPEPITIQFKSGEMFQIKTFTTETPVCIHVECPPESGESTVKVELPKSYRIYSPTWYLIPCENFVSNLRFEKSSLNIKNTGIFSTNVGCTTSTDKSFTVKKNTWIKQAASKKAVANNFPEEDWQDDVMQELESEDLNDELDSIVEVTSDLFGNAEAQTLQDMEERALRFEEHEETLK